MLLIFFFFLGEMTPLQLRLATDFPEGTLSPLGTGNQLSPVKQKPTGTGNWISPGKQKPSGQAPTFPQGTKSPLRQAPEFPQGTNCWQGQTPKFSQGTNSPLGQAPEFPQWTKSPVGTMKTVYTIQNTYAAHLRYLLVYTVQNTKFSMQPTCAIWTHWLLLRSQSLAVLSQEAVNTLVPSCAASRKDLSYENTPTCISVSQHPSQYLGLHVQPQSGTFHSEVKDGTFFFLLFLSISVWYLTQTIFCCDPFHTRASTL